MTIIDHGASIISDDKFGSVKCQSCKRLKKSALRRRTIQKCSKSHAFLPELVLLKIEGGKKKNGKSCISETLAIHGLPSSHDVAAFSWAAIHGSMQPDEVPTEMKKRLTLLMRHICGSINWVVRLALDSLLPLNIESSERLSIQMMLLFQTSRFTLISGNCTFGKILISLIQEI